MKRKRQFQFAKDTRFCNNPQGEINKMTNQLEQDIQDKAILTVYPTRIIEFGEPEPCISVRKTFIVEKRKGFRWNDIYEIINNIQAPHYKSI